MAKKIEVLRRGIPYTFDKILSIILPKLHITKIFITCSGILKDCTSTATAYISLHGLEMKINNKLFVNLHGRQAVTEESFIWAMYEEFYKQKHHVSFPNDHWEIEFPTPLPINATIELILLMSSSVELGCTDADAQQLIETFDISIEYDDAYVGKSLIPYIWGDDEWDTVATSGDHYKYIPPLPKPLRAVIIATETGDALSNSGYDRLTVRTPEKVYFDGAMSELKALQEGRSKFAQGTGLYIVQFKGGIKVDANTLLFNFYKTTGSNENLHLMYICY